MVPEYQKNAMKTYRSKHKQISILVTPDEKDAMVEAAKKAGLSMKEFIVKKCLS